jgi:GT2 family glycosyltransferase
MAAHAERAAGDDEARFRYVDGGDRCPASHRLTARVRTGRDPLAGLDDARWPIVQLTLVITTYERADALAAVLATTRAQRDPPDEIIVADDGSGPATAAVVEDGARHAPWPLRHIRQAHAGFRVTRVRNLAIAAARGDYIVFVDGDMLLDPRFIGDHRSAARPGSFVQGVRIPLTATATARLIAEPGRTPGQLDLRGAGLRRAYALHSAALQRASARWANRLIAIKGCNQGFWRQDLRHVNGFDESIEGWGPEDKELCARLTHTGIARRTLLGGGIAWHLWHAPASRASADANRAVLQQTLAERRVRCARGLDSHASAGRDLDAGHRRDLDAGHRRDLDAGHRPDTHAVL